MQLYLIFECTVQIYNTYMYTDTHKKKTKTTAATLYTMIHKKHVVHEVETVGSISTVHYFTCLDNMLNDVVMATKLVYQMLPPVARQQTQVNTEGTFGT